MNHSTSAPGLSLDLKQLKAKICTSEGLQNLWEVNESEADSMGNRQDEREESTTMAQACDDSQRPGKKQRIRGDNLTSERTMVLFYYWKIFR
jgi:hypothetical protein